MKFTEIATRLISIGTRFFSVGWAPSKTDAEIARRVIRFLKDRRVLFNSCAVEEPHHCVESVLQVRTRITAALEEAAEDSELFKHLAAIRAACRSFLDSGHVSSADDFRFRERYRFKGHSFSWQWASCGPQSANMWLRWR